MKVVILPGYRYPASLEEPLTCGDLRNTFNLSRALARLGVQVTVISRRGPSDPEEQRLDGVLVRRYRSELGRLFPTSFDVSLARRRAVRSAARDADVVVASTPLTLELAGPPRAPLVYICSGIEDVKNYGRSAAEVVQRVGLAVLRDPAKRRTWRRSARVNTTAALEAETLVRMGVPAGRVATIGPGVELERYQPAPPEEAAALRRALLPPGSGQRRLVLSVSRFTPAKGLLETVRAFARLRAARSDVFLLLVGVLHSHRADYLSRVRSEIATLGLSGDVAIHENLPESRMPACYSAAAVTSVFSVGYDPLPTVMIESMACGTPVVSTDFATRHQVVADGVDGMLVPENDAAAWCAAVARLLDDDAHAARIRAAALERARTQFDMNGVAGQYLQLFRAL